MSKQNDMQERLERIIADWGSSIVYDKGLIKDLAIYILEAGFVHKDSLELDFDTVKSIVSDCICKSAVFLERKIPDTALNILANEYADKISNAKDRIIKAREER